MTGAMSRNKGKRGELEVCHMLSDNLGGEYSRNLKQYQQSQHGDIEQLVGPYLIEVKNHAKVTVAPWWAQAVAAAGKAGAVPCLAYKIARVGWRFMVPIPQATWTGEAWALDLQYTQTLYPEGFYLLVREYKG